jgi:hypothetical protein
MCVATALLLLSALCPKAIEAAPIVWSSPMAISVDSDVSTNGQLVGAFNTGIPGVGSTTLNGVTFSPFAFSGMNVTLGNFSFAAMLLSGDNALTGSVNPPYSGLSASYRTLLDSIGGTIDEPFTLTIAGLTIGNQYEFQWWVSASAHPTNFQTAAAADNQVVLNSNLAGIDGGLGQYAIGVFVADNTTQSITFSGTGPNFLNGFQLRQLTASEVPEPASLALWGAASLGLTWFARRRRKIQVG